MLQTIGLSKNLLLLIEVAEKNKVYIIGGSNGDYKNKTIEKSPSKNLNGVAKYLILKA